MNRHISVEWKSISEQSRIAWDIIALFVLRRRPYSFRVAFLSPLFNQINKKSKQISPIKRPHSIAAAISNIKINAAILVSVPTLAPRLVRSSYYHDGCSLT